MSSTSTVARHCLALGFIAMAASANGALAATAQPLEALVAEPVAGFSEPVWRIGESRQLWTRCRISGFTEPSWADTYQISVDDGQNWLPLTTETSRGCRFHWLVRRDPAAPPLDAALASESRGAVTRPYDLSVAVNRFGDDDALILGGKWLPHPDYGLDTSLYYGDDLSGGTLTAAGRNLFATRGLDFTLTGGGGERDASARFGQFGLHDYHSTQQAWGGLIQYVPAEGAPLHGILQGAAVRVIESSTDGDKRSFNETLTDGSLQRHTFEVVGGTLRKQELALLTPGGYSLGANRERIDFAGEEALDSGLELLVGYHDRRLPGGIGLDIDAGYSFGEDEALYEGSLSLPLAGGSMGLRAEKTPLVEQQQISFGYGNCSLSVYHTEMKFGADDNGVLVGCGLTTYPRMRGPGYGSQLTGDLAQNIDQQGQIIAIPVRGADVYSLITASDRVRVREINPSPEQPPAAGSAPTARIAGLPESAAPAATLTADGSGSSDPDGPLASYLWTSAGSCTISAGTDGPQATVEIPADALNGATCRVSLTVTDSDGQSDTTSHDLQVETDGGVSDNTPPTAIIVGLADLLTAGQTVAIDGSSSFDAEGPISSYRWRVSSPCALTGTTNQSTAQLTTPDLLLAPVSCEVELVVTDSAGVSSSSLRLVTVTASHGVEIDGMPTILDHGQQIDVVAVLFQRSAGLSYAWSANGVCSLVSAGNSPAARLSVSASPAAQGRCNVSVTVTDQFGGQATANASSVLQAPVNLPPIAVLNITETSFAPGNSYDADANGSYDPEDQPIGYHWVVSGGWCAINGSDAENNIVVDVFSATPPGANCTITLTVQDEQGATDSATRTIPIL